MRPVHGDAASCMRAVWANAVCATRLVLAKLWVAAAVDALVIAGFHAASRMRPVRAFAVRAAGGVAAKARLTTAVDAKRRPVARVLLAGLLHTVQGIPPCGSQHGLDLPHGSLVLAADPAAEMVVIDFLDARSADLLDGIVRGRWPPLLAESSGPPETVSGVQQRDPAIGIRNAGPQALVLMPLLHLQHLELGAIVQSADPPPPLLRAIRDKHLRGHTTIPARPILALAVEGRVPSSEATGVVPALG
mmetsp:Transcript_9208/g.21544  ORF Transcript_9208/g.21544 Transcript_9208/m.21544 type:complete len:247 (-) Transcript_9208:829-1569(-)